jgi:hypothetical protein
MVTTGIWLFAECSLSGTQQKSLLLCVVLSKVLLSVMTTFNKSRTLDTEIHSAKKPMPSVKHSVNNGPRQRALSGRLKLTAVNFAESRPMALDKEASLPSVRRLTLSIACCAECLSWTLGKVYFCFFSFPNQNFCGMFLHYVDLHVPFLHNYKSVYYNY